MKDRLRKEGAPLLPADQPTTELDLFILAIHFVFIAAAAGFMWWQEYSIYDVGAGVILGIALYSLFWRWRYGFWPD